MAFNRFASDIHSRNTDRVLNCPVNMYLVSFSDYALDLLREDRTSITLSLASNVSYRIDRME